MEQEEYERKLRKRVVRMIQRRDGEGKYTDILRIIKSWGIEELNLFININKEK